jgi:hypothetical protein
MSATAKRQPLWRARWWHGEYSLAAAESSCLALHRFVEHEFNVTPRTAWQLDGFGHSTTEARLKKMGGFHALFFGRAHDQVSAPGEGQVSAEGSMVPAF